MALYSFRPFSKGAPPSSRSSSSKSTVCSARRTLPCHRFHFSRSSRCVISAASMFSSNSSSGFSAASSVTSPLYVLAHHRQAHRDVKPVQPMLRFGTQIHLQVANGITSIGQEHQLLIRLQPLCLQEFEKSALWLGIFSVYERKALRAAILNNALTDDDLERTRLPALFVARVHEPAVKPDRQRRSGVRQLVQIQLAGINEAEPSSPSSPSTRSATE